MSKSKPEDRPTMDCENCNGSGRVAVGPWGVNPPKEDCLACSGYGWIVLTEEKALSIYDTPCKNWYELRTGQTVRLESEEWPSVTIVVDHADAISIRSQGATRFKEDGWTAYTEAPPKPVTPADYITAVVSELWEQTIHTDPYEGQPIPAADTFEDGYRDGYKNGYLDSFRRLEAIATAALPGWTRGHMVGQPLIGDKL